MNQTTKAIQQQREAKEELERQKDMALHQERVIDALLSIPKEELTVRSTPQYTFRCKQCGYTRFFDIKEDMYATREIHRPRMYDPTGRPMGRAYNCDLRPVTKPSRVRKNGRGGNPTITYARIDSILSRSEQIEMDLEDGYKALWDRIKRLREQDGLHRSEEDSRLSPDGEQAVEGTD